MKKRAKSNATAQAAEQILKNGKINKSELIRAYAAEHPDDKPAAIATALLAKTGTTFAPQLISQVLNKAKAKANGSKRKSATIGEAEFNVIVQVKQCADRIGGIEVLRNATKALEKLFA